MSNTLKKIEVGISMMKKKVSDEDLKKFKEEYAGIILKDPQDVEEYKSIKEKHDEVRKPRLEIDKLEKKLKDELNAEKKKVIDEAKRITDVMKPIEQSLRLQMKKHEDWKENEKIRIQKEKEDKMFGSGYVKGAAGEWISPKGSLILSQEKFDHEYDAKIEDWVALGEKETKQKEEDERLLAEAKAKQAEEEARKKAEEEANQKKEESSEEEVSKESVEVQESLGFGKETTFKYEKPTEEAVEGEDFYRGFDKCKRQILKLIELRPSMSLEELKEKIVSFNPKK